MIEEKPTGTQTPQDGKPSLAMAALAIYDRYGEAAMLDHLQEITYQCVPNPCRLSDESMVAFTGNFYSFFDPEGWESNLDPNTPFPDRPATLSEAEQLERLRQPVSLLWAPNEKSLVQQYVRNRRQEILEEELEKDLAPGDLPRVENEAVKTFLLEEDFGIQPDQIRAAAPALPVQARQAALNYDAPEYLIEILENEVAEVAGQLDDNLPAEQIEALDQVIRQHVHNFLKDPKVKTNLG